MPAITVDDITVLPRIPGPDPVVARQRPVRQLTSAPSRLRGRGLPGPPRVRRRRLEDLDPFVHLDQMGEVEYAPGEPKGTPWHPHRGFETVTYMIDGVFEHNDSNGGGGVDHQRRHAVDDRRRRDPAHREAAGVARRAGRPVPRLPAVGQPAAGAEVAAPRYQDIRASEVALASSPDGGALVRVIAGEVAGHAGPGLDLHADDPRPRDAEPGRRASAPVALGLQRARLRAGRSRHGRRRGPSRADGPARGLRAGRRADVRRGPGPGQPTRRTSTC